MQYTFAALLLGLSSNIAARVLTSLGIGVVTYVGLAATVGQALAEVQARLGGLPSSVAAYMAMAGVNVALGVIGGAITARVALVATKKLAFVGS